MLFNAIFACISKNKLSLFLSFFVLSFILYLNTQDGRLSSDFYNWVNTYEQGSLSDLWTCFGYPGMHQLYHIPFFLSYKLFGLNAWAWHIEFLAIHSLNALLLFLFAKKILQETKENTKWAYLPALLFLLSPYQTEVVSWGACIHYLLMTSFLLFSLLYLLNFIKSNDTKKLVLFHVFYILALFCMEQSYLFIVVYFVFAFIFQRKYKLRLCEILAKITLPQMAIFGIYFVIMKYSVGSFIGHYGADTHLNFNIDLLSDNLFKYIGKFLFFFRYTFTPIDNFLKHFVLNDGTQIIVGVLFFIIGVYFMFFKKFTDKVKIPLVLFTLGAFACVLAPTLNLSMFSHESIQTDRYSYVASPFIFMFLMFFICSLPKQIGLAVALFYITFSAYNLHKANTAWVENGVLKNRIIESFPKEEKRTIYLINQPDNHKGAHLFRNGLDVALDFEYGTSLRANKQLNYIVLHNTLNIDDSCSVRLIDENTYAVELTHWGRWIHGVNYETNAYKVTEKWDTGFNFSVLPNESDSVVFMKLDKGEWQYFK